MSPRYRLPTTWLFTDPRMGDGVLATIDRLPRGSGIVFRHYGLCRREVLARLVAGKARRYGHVLVIAGDPRLARRVGAAGLHLPERGPLRKALTASAHGLRGIVRARRAGAALVFLSPVFPTRSHPGIRTMGRVRFGQIAHRAGMKVAALGGMNTRAFRSLRQWGAHAWGAIDAFTIG